jgi:trehalose 6-phosphate synthase
VWVHDYHLQRVPALLRPLRPDVRIGFFLHIPFPPPELFRQIPWRERLLEGLLAADLLGFHTKAYADNFRATAAQLAAAQARAGELITDAGEALLGAFPISIDYRFFDDLARRPAIRQSAARLRSKLGHDRRIVLGVDRLDYTKGIEDRLRAYLRLLDDGRIRAAECVLVQIAVPSREQIRNYAEQRAAVERLVGEINGRHAEPGRAAVHYVYRSLSIERLVPYYVAADVMAVTPLRDGMNLVAKEYVASRIEEDGVLLLSEFAGAAEELTQATLVNPHDRVGLGEAMAACLTADPTTARANMSALRRTVRRHDVHRWAAEFLRALDRSVPRHGALPAEASAIREGPDALFAPAPSWLQ